MLTLPSNPSLFLIANHGTNHRPASVNGNSAYGIKGTRSVEELVYEIEGNAREIEHLTGKRPTFYRSGTANYDDVAVAIAWEFGIEVVNFNINGDAGAQFTTNQIVASVLKTTSGSIIIIHGNHPEGATAEGIQIAISKLKKQGFSFVQLGENHN